MSTIDLILLGVLMQKPMNAYEMKKEMEYRNIKDWVKISSPSVYKNLVKLYHSGYVDGKTVREGEMPEKTIYKINDTGKEYFLQLMKRYSEDPAKIYADFSAFIANLSHVDYDTGLKMIESLQISLALERDTIIGQLEIKDGATFYATAVIHLYLQIYEFFCSWVEDFKKQYTDHQGIN
jgi:DNA-binding PadR family transcriptional regulator